MSQWPAIQVYVCSASFTLLHTAGGTCCCWALLGADIHCVVGSAKLFLLTKLFFCKTSKYISCNTEMGLLIFNSLLYNEKKFTEVVLFLFSVMCFPSFTPQFYNMGCRRGEMWENNPLTSAPTPYKNPPSQDFNFMPWEKRQPKVQSSWEERMRKHSRGAQTDWRTMQEHKSTLLHFQLVLCSNIKESNLWFYICLVCLTM